MGRFEAKKEKWTSGSSKAWVKRRSCHLEHDMKACILSCRPSAPARSVRGLLRPSFSSAFQDRMQMTQHSGGSKFHLLGLLTWLSKAKGKRTSFVDNESWKGKTKKFPPKTNENLYIFILIILYVLTYTDYENCCLTRPNGRATENAILLAYTQESYSRWFPPKKKYKFLLTTQRKMPYSVPQHECFFSIHVYSYVFNRARTKIRTCGSAFAWLRTTMEWDLISYS